MKSVAFWCRVAFGGVCLVVCLGGAASAREPELGVSGPVPAPIRHRPWWRLERALFGYRPWFRPGVTGFGPENVPYIRVGDTIQTPDGSGGWADLPFADAVKALHPGWDGAFATGHFAEEHVVFDDTGDAYTICNATRSTPGRIYLLYSRDRCRSWQAYEIGSGFARLERRDGHNDLSACPAVLVFTTGSAGTLRLLVPRKTAAGGLDVSGHVVISTDSLLVPNHSGGGNSAVTIGQRTHVFFPGRTPRPGEETSGTPEYAVTYDRATGELSAPVFLGLGGAGRPDAHNLPAVCADSEGFLHVVLGAHHEPFKYMRSLRPNSVVGGWTAPEPFGTLKRSTSEGSYTYVGLVCDSRDTLHCVARWAGDSYTFKLAYLRKKQGAGWEGNRDLVVPFKGNYHVWYHKLGIDRRDRLFLNYVCRASIKRPDEVASFAKKWPGGELDTRFLTASPCLLMSDDGGDSWRLATSAAFGMASPVVSGGAERAGPVEVRSVSADAVAHVGGAFGPVTRSGNWLFAGVGSRVAVFDMGDAARPRLVHQTGDVGDTVFEIASVGRTVFVGAWRAGLVWFVLGEDGGLRQAGHVDDAEARKLAVAGNRLYVTCGKGGVRCYDVSGPGDITEAGRFEGIEAYAVAVSGSTAYVGMGHKGLRMLDVSNPARIASLGNVFAPESSTDRIDTCWFLRADSTRLYVSPGPAPVSLRIFDISSPRVPRETYRLPENWGWGRKLSVVDEHIYFPGLNGLRVLRVTDEGAAVDVGGWGESGVAGVAVRDGVAVVSLGAAGLRVLDVSDPGGIRELGRFEQPSTPFAAASVGGRLVLADWGRGLSLLEDCAAGLPELVGTDDRFGDVLGLGVSGDRVYAARGTEGVSILEPGEGGTFVELGRLRAGVPMRDVAADGVRAFVAEGGGGIAVWDVRDPARPLRSGTVSTPREVLSLCVAGSYLVTGEMMEVVGGVRVYRIGPDGVLTEVDYLETGNDVWALHAVEERVYAALAGDGVLELALDAAGALRPLHRLDVGEAVCWGAVGLHGPVAAVLGRDGLSVLRMQSANGQERQ